MKQEQFCQEYIASRGNGAEAARKVYDIASENRDLVARVIASQNLDRPLISNRIKELQESIAEKSLAEIEKGALHKAVVQATRILAHADEDCIKQPCHKCTDIKEARRFLLDVTKAFETSGEKLSEHKHLHLTFPKRT